MRPASVHQSHPFHGVGSFECFGSSRAPCKLRHDKVNPAPGGFVNLGAMLMQLLICDKGGVEVGAVLFKVGFPQPPVMPDIRARGGGGLPLSMSILMLCVLLSRWKQQVIQELPAVLSPVPVALSIVCASSPYSGGYTRLSSPCVVPVPLMLP